MRNNIELKGITWDHVRGYGPLYASIEPYEEKTGVRVIWEKRSLKDFGDVPIEDLACKYDLIILDHPHMAVAASTRCILPIDEMLHAATYSSISENSVGPSFQSYNYDGHQWALPIDAACQISAYRNELRKEHQIPKEWVEVFVFADRLKQQKKSIAMALCATDCNASFLTLCAQEGHPWTENHEQAVPTAVGYKVLKMLRRLYEVCHPDSIYWNPINLYDYMASENDVLYSPLAFGYINYTQPEYAKNPLLYAPIPGLVGALLGGAGIAVSSYSRHISAAAEYAVWLCEEEFQSTTYIESGGQPAHKRAWLDKEANEKTDQFFLSTLPSIENAYVRPRSLNWPDFQEELGDILHSFLLTKKDIELTWNRITACHDSHLKNALKRS